MKAQKLAEWTGRIGGLVISCIFLAFLIGEATDGLLKNSADLMVKFVPLLALAIFGNILAWFMPKIGGAIIILSGMLMLDFHLLRQDLLTGAVYGLPFVIVGAAFIFSGQEVSNPKKNPN